MFKVPATYRSPEVRCTEHETPFSNDGSNDGVAPEGAACIDESRRADSSSSSLRRSSLTGDGGPAGGPSSTAGDVGGSSVLPRDDDFCSDPAAIDDDPAETREGSVRLLSSATRCSGERGLSTPSSPLPPSCAMGGSRSREPPAAEVDDDRPKLLPPVGRE